MDLRRRSPTQPPTQDEERRIDEELAKLHRLMQESKAQRAQTSQLRDAVREEDAKWANRR